VATEFSGERDAVLQAAAWAAAGRRAALATVIATWGSSPRPVGSMMAVADGGEFIGSVSGGCVEGVVIHEALKCLDDGEPRLLRFSVSDDQAWEVGLACGGKMEIYVEPVEEGRS
jgi:xanthine/CO dehydrogenase XdhC/CoxF family maturation factor